MKGHKYVLVGVLVTSAALAQVSSTIDPLKLQRDEVPLNASSLTFHGNTVEILGVCSVGEERLTCWKPDGSKDATLTKDVHASLTKDKDHDYARTFQFRFGMKNRLLIVKKTMDRRSAVGYVGPYSLPRSDYDAPGWIDTGTMISQIIPRAIEEPMVDSRLMLGRFPKSSTTYPFRYQTIDANSSQTTIPFATGSFSIGGNDYVIDYVSDTPEKPDDERYVPPGLAKTKSSYVKIHASKVGDPNSILTMYPANENGRIYAGMNAKWEPIFHQDFGQLQLEQFQKDAQAQKAGKFQDSKDRFDVFAHSIYPIQFDVTAGWRKGIFSGSFAIELSKVKTLVISTQKRTVYLFQNIHLDPK